MTMDLAITIRRLDGRAISRPERRMAEEFAHVAMPEHMEKYNAGDGLSVVQFFDDEGRIWLQGPYDVTASNPVILNHTSEILARLERTFGGRFEAEYNVTVEWAMIDEDYVYVEQMKTYEPFLTVKTNMGYGEVK